MRKRKLLISQCLLGVPCKWDGSVKKYDFIDELEKRFALVAVCPEVLGGLDIPRDPCEIYNGRVITKDGWDCTYEFDEGASVALNICKGHSIKTALMKDRSPSCGCGTIHNGKFDGGVIPGFGVTTKLLGQNGIDLYNENMVEELITAEDERIKRMEQAMNGNKPAVKISRDTVIAYHSKDDEPAAYCESGDIVEFETRNCYDDRLCADGTVIEPEKAIDNPATGPLFVKGAMPGDVLKVEILDIRLKGKGYMRQSVVGGAFYERPGVKERVVREFDVSGETMKFNDKLEFPINTMIGVIGTAPEGEPVTTENPWDHGGNMDCTRIVKGATLYLPVNTEGALLAMGDMHALMGDGEIMICGVESAGYATVRVTVVKNFKMPTPCLLTADGKKFVTIQSEKDLMAASKKAGNRMLDFLIDNTDLGEYDGGKLLSIKSDLIVCAIVNEFPSVRLEIDKYILDQYDVKLP